MISVKERRSAAQVASVVTNSICPSSFKERHMERNTPLPARRVAGVVFAAILVAAHAAEVRASLVIEPVFMRVPGSGQGPDNFPLYDPTYLVNGIAYYLADEPGEIDLYAAGDPRDPDLDVLHIWNNTQYALTSFTMRIIGTATDTLDPGTIVRGPVDAVFGDVDGDGKIGRSDIFSTITVSADGKEIRFEGGVIPIGGRFTDIHLASSDNPPELAGIESFFGGTLSVPEPASSTLAGIGVAALLLYRYGRHVRRAAGV